MNLSDIFFASYINSSIFNYIYNEDLQKNHRTLHSEVNVKKIAIIFELIIYVTGSIPMFINCQFFPVYRI